MAVIKTLAVSAENTWSAKFAMGGDYSLGRETSRALTLSPDCPGTLRQVQEWKKVASARDIERY